MDDRNVMSSLTVALRRKGLTQTDAVRMLRERYRIDTSLAELSRSLTKHRRNPKKLEPKEQAICKAVAEIAENQPTPEAPIGNEFTLMVQECGMKMTELHRIYCEWYDSDVDYKTWHGAVTKPLIGFQYRIAEKTDVVLREVMRANARTKITGE